MASMNSLAAGSTDRLADLAQAPVKPVLVLQLALHLVEVAADGLDQADIVVE